MTDPRTAISALVTPAEQRLVSDPGLWHALDPHHGSLPGRAADALRRLVAAELRPTLHALAKIDDPTGTKDLVAQALTQQSAGMTTLAHAIEAKNPATAARLSRHASAQLRSAAHTLAHANLPAVGGA